MDVVSAELKLRNSFGLSWFHRPGIVDVAVSLCRSFPDFFSQLFQSHKSGLALLASAQNHVSSAQCERKSIACTEMRIERRASNGGWGIRHRVVQRKQSPFQSRPGDAHMPEFGCDLRRK